MPVVQKKKKELTIFFASDRTCVSSVRMCLRSVAAMAGFCSQSRGRPFPLRAASFFCDYNEQSAEVHHTMKTYQDYVIDACPVGRDRVREDTTHRMRMDDFLDVRASFTASRQKWVRMVLTFVSSLGVQSDAFAVVWSFICRSVAKWKSSRCFLGSLKREEKSAKSKTNTRNSHSPCI